MFDVPIPRASSAAGLERAEYIAPNGRTVSYLRAGDAESPRVIFIHGTPGDATNFSAYLNDPIEGLEAIAVDRPGFGGSAEGGVEVSFQEQAAALDPLLVERDGRWPILVGHSLGGPIAARLAADEPDRVSGLVILAGSMSPDLEKPRWYNHAASMGVISSVLGHSLRTSNREIMAAPLQTRYLDQRLGSVRCPVVVVHGTKDSLVPVRNVEYLQRRWAERADVWYIVLPGANHFIPWTHEPTIRGAIGSLRDDAAPEGAATAGGSNG